MIEGVGVSKSESSRGVRARSYPARHIHGCYYWRALVEHRMNGGSPEYMGLLGQDIDRVES